LLEIIGSVAKYFIILIHVKFHFCFPKSKTIFRLLLKCYLFCALFFFLWISSISLEFVINISTFPNWAFSEFYCLLFFKCETWLFLKKSSWKLTISKVAS